MITQIQLQLKLADKLYGIRCVPVPPLRRHLCSSCGRYAYG